MKRYFGLLPDAKIISLGLFDSNSPTLEHDIGVAALKKTGSIGGMILSCEEVYRIVETGKEALNDAS